MILRYECSDFTPMGLAKLPLPPPESFHGIQETLYQILEGFADNGGGHHGGGRRSID